MKLNNLRSLYFTHRYLKQIHKLGNKLHCLLVLSNFLTDLTLFLKYSLCPSQQVAMDKTQM